MASFESHRYPNLLVKFANGDRVKFNDGEVEVSGDTAERLAAFADTHPDYQIEQVEGDRRETPKQKAQREARERGLDDSGTLADIEARIAEHDAQADDDADDEDDSTEE